MAQLLGLIWFAKKKKKLILSIFSFLWKITIPIIFFSGVWKSQQNCEEKWILRGENELGWWEEIILPPIFFLLEIKFIFFGIQTKEKIQDSNSTNQTWPYCSKKRSPHYAINAIIMLAASIIQGTTTYSTPECKYKLMIP